MGFAGAAVTDEDDRLSPADISALREFVVIGPATTISYHRAILDSADFRAGKLSTRFIEEHPELVDQAKRYASDTSPFDYGADPRHMAAAAAAVAVVVQKH